MLATRGVPGAAGAGPRIFLYRYPCKGLWWLDVFRKRVTVDGRNPASPGNNVYR